MRLTSYITLVKNRDIRRRIRENIGKNVLGGGDRASAAVLRPTGGRPQAICQKKYMLTVHTSECIPSLQLRLLGVSVTDVVA